MENRPADLLLFEVFLGLEMAVWKRGQNAYVVYEAAWAVSNQTFPIGCALCMRKSTVLVNHLITCHFFRTGYAVLACDPHHDICGYCTQVDKILDFQLDLSVHRRNKWSLYGITWVTFAITTENSQDFDM